MELTATYKELSSYIQARFGQPVSLAAAEDGELKVTYTKRILIKDVHVSIGIHFDEVTADTVTLSYKGALGLDMIVGGVLSFFTSQLPELAAGIHPHLPFGNQEGEAPCGEHRLAGHSALRGWTQDRVRAESAWEVTGRFTFDKPATHCWEVRGRRHAAAGGTPFHLFFLG